MNYTVATIALAATLSGGCATLFNGKIAPVTVQSQTPGAHVTVDGFVVGVTPIIIPLDTSRPHMILVTGYGGQYNCVVQTNIGPLWVVLDILFGVWPLVVDAITGAWNETDGLCFAPV